MLLLVGAVVLQHIHRTGPDNVQRGAELAFAVDHVSRLEVLDLDPTGEVVQLLAVDVREQRRVGEHVFNRNRHSEPPKLFYSALGADLSGLQMQDIAIS